MRFSSIHIYYMAAMTFPAAFVVHILALSRPGARKDLFSCIKGFALRYSGICYALFAATVLFNITAIKTAPFGAGNAFSLNLIPFRTIVARLARGETGSILVGLAILMPMPVLISANFTNLEIRKIARFSAIVTLLVEPLQLLANMIMRCDFNSVDIDDLILNAIGALLGLALARLIVLFRSRRKSPVLKRL